MIKCFLLGIGILFCTEQNVNVKCVDDNLKTLLAVGTPTVPALNHAVAKCIISKEGCCSWHGGVSHYNQDEHVYICWDGTTSPTCRK